MITFRYVFKKDDVRTFVLESYNTVEYKRELAQHLLEIREKMPSGSLQDYNLTVQRMS